MYIETPEGIERSKHADFLTKIILDPLLKRGEFDTNINTINKPIGQNNDIDIIEKPKNK